MVEQLTIHGALRELKLLENRIDKGINSANFISSKKRSSKTESLALKTIEDFEKEAKSKLDSIEALIKRRNTIKNAIIISNATTMVKVGEEEMTVAEAIERKTSIYHDRALLSTLKSQYRRSFERVERENASMEMALDRQVHNLTEGDATKISEIQSFVDMYRKDNGWDLVDPLGIEKMIDTATDRIEDFMANVDEALSVSNAVTTIDV